jgi:hypothetical protein
MSHAATFEDFFNLMCGRQLGEGVHRTVYAHSFDRALVFKVEKTPTNGRREFPNVREHDAWLDATEKQRAWLAPCVCLSPDGRVLIQRRVEPLPRDYELPTQLPKFIVADMKPENFGLLDNRLVCIDYAYINAPFSGRLINVKWHKDANE